MTVERTPMVRELGRGRPILVVHGGMGNEVPWLRVAEAMSNRYRVVLIRRRLYRLDIPVRVEQTIADQVAEVVDVARGFGEPCVIVGHSSGALIALEALAADPGPFAGGVIYEPPTPLPDLPLGEPGLGPRARAALADGHVGRALQIYLREGFRAPHWLSTVAPALALLPVVRKFVPRQIDDYESMVRLGVRSDAYVVIDRPLWILVGEKSPTHFRQRSARLARTHPRADLVTLPQVGHNANQSHPRQLGDLICDFAKLLFDESAGTHVTGPRRTNAGNSAGSAASGDSRGSSSALTYDEVGAAASAELPSGYRHLHEWRQIGFGQEWFVEASQRLLSWHAHRRAGVRVDTASPVSLDQTVVLRLRFGPLKFTAPVRVVDYMDTPTERGFAYGTLPGHPEIGEERFAVQIDDDDIVWAEIRAFSRPGRWFTRLADPLARRVQGAVTRRYLRALEDDRLFPGRRPA